MPTRLPLDQGLESEVRELLADERYRDHPLRQVLVRMLAAMEAQVARLERVTLISDRYQSDAQAKVRDLSARYDNQIKRLERVIRISDRYQTMLKELNRALRQSSTHDQLTGIPNRLLMTERCRQEDERSLRYGSSYCLIVLDADHFKEINDGYGHDVGDKMLVELAWTLRDCLRLHDLCARWGGEEFLCLICEADLPMAESVAQRILDRIRAFRLLSEGQEISLTVSMGIASHRSGESYADTFRRADAALLEAKRAGRDCYHSAPLLEEPQEGSEIEA